MKDYPSTHPFEPKYANAPCIAFYKYDGSNLRFEYNRRSKRWYKFGTRRRLFDLNDPEYGSAIPLFLAKYGDGLAKVFHDSKEWRNAESMIAYAEFVGPQSFAGVHVESDPKDVILFDVNIHRRGLIDPKTFVKTFGHMPIAEVVYEGPLTYEFREAVRNGGVYNLNEGVMCKGGSGHKLWICKIKTLDYLARLKARYAERWMEFWE